jgi:hypothetical protein
MAQLLSPQQVINQWQREFEQKITLGIKSLLETKHLYQNITLEYESLFDTLGEMTVEITGKQTLEDIKTSFSESIQANWFAIDRPNPNYISGAGGKYSPFCFETPDIKLFCHKCERVEAANSISSEDFFQRESTPRYFLISGQRVQVFVFSFLCQSCKSVPEVFLVRRQGLRLTLSGRSPIEHIDVPRVIPNQVKGYYSGAVVAHQSGQTLAGIFLLRTVIEQWARHLIPDAPRDADKLLDAYMSTLPDDFKVRFPSFRNLYENLSDDMHAAKGNAQLFEKVLADIEEHFEARPFFMKPRR